ncbi:Heterogeneous nuclear ribonucleoprotein like [Actinidia chinensis var. chinensis]|uniref:Heterogeneous nuclear ribonucleoprotein like n=1 Tax=Actinidia chinensis var. chinensis TaxID=1590841 RepID=A0A2R6Q269_ACTCC|nr:Heterogeneous nuclear ribonucleoprotein like [Actinidia chinensis var. chinensis]
MKTRNATTTKQAAVKKTPPARKSTVKTPPNPPPESATESSTPKTTETNSASASEAKDATTPIATADSKPQQPVEQPKAPADSVKVTPETKVGTGPKATKTVVRKVPVRTKTPTSAKSVSGQTPKAEPSDKPKVEESSGKEEVGDAKDVVSGKKEESSVSNVVETSPETELTMPNPTETKSASKTKTDDTMTIVAAVLKPEQLVEQAKALPDAVKVTPGTKVGTGTKATKTVVRRTPARTKTLTPAKLISRQTPKAEQTGKSKVEESSKKEEVGDAKDVGSAHKEDISLSRVEESAKKVEAPVENVEDTKRKEDENGMNVEESPQKEERIVDMEHPLGPNVEISTRQVDPAIVGVEQSPESQEAGIAKEEKVKEDMEEMGIIEDKVGNETLNLEEGTNESRGDDVQPEDEHHVQERMEESRDDEVLEEFGEEELAEDDMPEHGEEAEALEEEHMELTAAAKERKIRKELEIFVGGLDRDAVEEDVKKAFENIGEVVEVRLHKNTSTNKNKGYAFVKFATKDQASQALSEMKNPLIRGKRCGTAPSDDNDTLFLGNICNTWTKEAIKQKLKDYGIEGVENITLVADARREGLSRGFAFVELSCHVDAMLAYKRLQKPDVIFGHSERTAKVAFAEPLREPDPEVMAQVKSVFVDGLPPHWDEDKVREQFQIYGEIVRIMLARNMSTAKRRDFGFVDFTAHEAAVACVEGINNADFGDGNSKTKVRARLSNPLPKSQAIKGGMCGGFRIGRGGSGSFSKSGRGFGRGGPAFNRPNFQRGRGFYQRGGGQNWRMGFAREHDLDIQYPPFQRREMFGRGGWRDSFRGAYDASSGGAVPTRPNLDRIRHDAPDIGRGRHIRTSRQPFPHEEGFNRPFIGRHFDDPYFYDDHPHGIKRPLFMRDQDPDYLEPARLRPRLNYSDPAASVHVPRYRDSFAAGSSLYSRDYYGSDYGEVSYPSFYGNDHPYGRGYYY